ncbi:MAG: malonyl-[acyl-carrier protein] O-methyltransferase BioC [Legionellales bacterium RIFCSPHIGHO2_12_FULL_42_9]|nr:MAG: malonyl-[acyl-carrier protein] O-methyltransferase BioC [Legionellales bacterium RIFCSPHIGHO2_12_FULL_42_9]
MTIKTEIRNSFDKHAADYDKSAKIQREIGLRLFERLDYLKISPRYILDLGCGTGFFSRLLKKKYRQAEVISLDFSFNMLLEAQHKQSWRHQWFLVNADMVKMPFAEGVFDLIFANQTLHWDYPVATVLCEMNRVMNTEGCLMFSTLGPDTFKELVEAWSAVDHYTHTNQFIDMHNLGDALMRECFLDPVVDQELLTGHYASLTALLTSLKKQGMRNISQSRHVGLTGRQARGAFNQAYELFCTPEGRYPLTYEVVYGQAWKGTKRRSGQGTEAYIPVSQIR